MMIVVAEATPLKKNLVPLGDDDEGIAANGASSMLILHQVGIKKKAGKNKSTQGWCKRKDGKK